MNCGTVINEHQALDISSRATHIQMDNSKHIVEGENCCQKIQNDTKFCK